MPLRITSIPRSNPASKPYRSSRDAADQAPAALRFATGRVGPRRAFNSPGQRSGGVQAAEATVQLPSCMRARLPDNGHAVRATQ
jgi:hypothetical protein